MNAFAKPLVSSVREKGRGSRGSGRGGGRWPRRVPSAFPPRRRALGPVSSRPLRMSSARRAPGTVPAAGGQRRGRRTPWGRRAPEGDGRPCRPLPPGTKTNQTRPRTGTPGGGERRGEPHDSRTEVLSFHATAQGGPRRGPADPRSRCKNGLGVWGDPSNRIRRASPREERAPRSAEARPEGLGARWAAVWDRGRSGGRARPRLSGERTPRGAGQSPSCLRSGGQAPRVTRGSAPTESKTQGTTLFSRNSLHPGTGFFPEVRTPGTRREEIQSIRHPTKDDPPGRQSGPGRRRKTDQLRPNGNRSGR